MPTAAAAAGEPAAATAPAPRSTLSTPRMRDVAQLAGVSTQTVSNFVHGRTARLSTATRERVQASMEQVGYRPARAQHRTGATRTRTLGFLVLDDSERFLADPLTAAYLSGMGDVARAHDFSLLVHSSLEADENFLRPVLDREVSGVCLLLSGPRARRQRVADRVAESGLPFVLLDEVVPQSRVGYLTVLADQRDGARQLVAHLIERGHRRIAFVAAASEWAVLEERYAGYRAGLRECGVPFESCLAVFDGGWEPTDVGPGVNALLALPEPPSAIMCGSDLMALGVIRHLLDLGIRVPEDIAVCGFDDFVFAPHMHPPLTTVAVPAWEMGQAAARLLLTALSGRSIARREVLLPVELRLRGSA